MISGVRGSDRIVEFILQGLAGKDLLDAKSFLVRGSADIGDNAGHQFGIGEPDERAVVGDVKRFGRADGGCGLAATNWRRLETSMGDWPCLRRR